MGELKRAIYAGTFDPFTNGHQDICVRALKFFDELVVLIAVSPNKKPLFSADQRYQMLSTLFKNEKRIKVELCAGLTVDYARQERISSIVRGLRPTGDFDNEFLLASMNRKLNSAVETIFLVSDERFSYISSTLVKEIYGHRGDISNFVPDPILDEFKKLGSN